MFKRTMMVVVAMLVVMAAGYAAAQCTVGVYADANGTVSSFIPTQGTNFHIYVVLFAENAVNAVAYDLDLPGLNTEIFIISQTYGPSGGRFNVSEATGNNVGLGECAIGFGGLPILVTDYEVQIPFPTSASRTVSV